MEVQHYLDIWLSELYQRKPHSALSGKTPEQVFKEDDRPLRWATKEELDWAFTFTEQRLVDKTGCISFSGISLGSRRRPDRYESRGSLPM